MARTRSDKTEIRHLRRVLQNACDCIRTLHPNSPARMDFKAGFADEMEQRIRETLRPRRQRKGGRP